MSRITKTLVLFAFGLLLMAPAAAQANDWRAGSRVKCNWLGLGTIYNGTIQARMGDKVSILYDDGDREVTTKGRCTLTGPPPGGKTSGTLGGLAVGTKVTCNWQKEGRNYNGKIDMIVGSKIRVLYDDGDEELTEPGQCRAAGAPAKKAGGDAFQVGSRVQCNWKGLGVYYNGKIASRDGDKVNIHYDDGDRETTSVGMCRTP